MDLGVGDVLVSMDCDNFITPAWLQAVTQPDALTHVLTNWSGNHFDGTRGRLSVPRKMWHTSSKFREDLMSCGLHDTDFISSHAHCVTVVPFDGTLPILNTKEDTKRYTPCSSMSWPQVSAANRLIDFISKQDITVNLRANEIGAKSGMASRWELMYPFSKCTFEYCVTPSRDWVAGKGGKLPGLAGGSLPTAGQVHKIPGFSARIMWREEGQLEVYVYHPMRQSQYGISHKCNAFLQPGRTTKITQLFEVGIVTTYIDNVRVACDVHYPTCSTILHHVFRGGSTGDWAVSTSSTINLSDYRIILE